MLELRPTCEHCNKDLPANSIEAMICTYECTFCKDCVETVLEGVCPNCGGNFCQRPIRPSHNLKGDYYLGKDPASNDVVYQSVNKLEHKAFSQTIKEIPAYKR